MDTGETVRVSYDDMKIVMASWEDMSCVRVLHQLPAWEKTTESQQCEPLDGWGVWVTAQWARPVHNECPIMYPRVTRTLLAAFWRSLICRLILPINVCACGVCNFLFV